MYCKDCFYFKKDRDEGNGLFRGECSNKKFRFDYELINEDELIYHDSEGYSAGFYVGELFGCIHFKGRR